MSALEIVSTRDTTLEVVADDVGGALDVDLVLTSRDHLFHFYIAFDRSGILSLVTLEGLLDMPAW